MPLFNFCIKVLILLYNFNLTKKCNKLINNLTNLCIKIKKRNGLGSWTRIL